MLCPTEPLAVADEPCNNSQGSRPYRCYVQESQHHGSARSEDVEANTLRHVGAGMISPWRCTPGRTPTTNLIILQMWQQLLGGNVMLYYLVYIFNMSGEVRRLPLVTHLHSFFFSIVRC